MPLIVIIIVLGLVIYDDQRKKEMIKNTKSSKPIIGYDTQTGVPLYEGEKVVGYNTQTGEAIISGREEKTNNNQPKEKKPIDKTKVSNSLLMIVGAALVVFATAVFLTSSWDSIPGIIKPFILVFIQIIFFGSAKICKDKLDIPKTGEVFNYLALVFIPVILVSFSCFELIGNELSINGSYAPLYFSICFIISDIIFKIYANKKNDLAIKMTSYILEISAVLSIAKFIDIDYLYLIIISIYTSIILILVNYRILDHKAYKIINIVFIAISMVLTRVISYEETSYLFYIPYLIYTILFLIMYFISKDKKDQQINIAFFFVNYFFAITYLGAIEKPRVLYYLNTTIPLLAFAKLTKNESIENICKWIVFAATTLILITSLVSLEGNIYDTLTFLMGTIIFATEFTLFDKDREIFKLATYAGFTILLINTCYQTGYNNLSKYVLIAVALLIYLFEKSFPKIQDSSSKYVVPSLLAIESIILGISTAIHEAEYTIIIPLILMMIYTKVEKTNEEYLIVPTFASLSLFFKEPTTLNVGICSTLVLLYSIISALKGKINIYTFVSIITIIFGLPFLKANSYIVFLTLGVWSIIHFITNKEHRELFKFSSIVSILGLYLKLMSDLKVGYNSIYFLGLFLALIATTKLAFKEETKEVTLLECIVFGILTFLSLGVVNDPVDGVIMIIIFFIMILLSFVKQYKPLLYCSLIAMILHIFKQTIDFWKTVPVYIYILLIGLILIAFAMLDEKRKKQKNDKKIKDKKDNIE